MVYKGLRFELLKEYAISKNIALKKEAARSYLNLMLLFEDRPSVIKAVERLRSIRDVFGNKGLKVAKESIKDYPTVICRCCLLDRIKNNDVVVSYLGRSKVVKAVFFRNKLLLKKMNEIGGLGHKNNKQYCPYPIGNCAEQHAAQFLLNKENVGGLDEIFFSDPIRPRDGKLYSYCVNCKYILEL